MSSFGILMKFALGFKVRTHFCCSCMMDSSRSPLSVIHANLILINMAVNSFSHLLIQAKEASLGIRIQALWLSF